MKRTFHIFRPFLHTCLFCAVTLFTALPEALQAQQPPSFGLEFEENAYRSLPLLRLSEGEKGIDTLKRLSLRPFAPMPGQQGKISACTGYAGGYGAMTILHAVRSRLKSPEEIKQVTFSAAYVYNSVKQRHGDCGEGIRLEKALQFLKEQGNCLYPDFDTTQQCVTKPDTALAKKARYNTIKDFAPILPLNSQTPQIVNSVKTCLRDSLPVIVVIKVFPSLLGMEKGERIWQKRVREESVGLHCLVVTGYDERKSLFEVMSSWGTEWADGGFAYIDYGDMGAICQAAYTLVLTDWPESALPKSSQMTTAVGQAMLSRLILEHQTAFVRVTEQDTGYVFSKEPVVLDNTWGGYTLKAGVVPVGTNFQLVSSGDLSGKYVYVFTCDAAGNITLHHPLPYYSALRVGQSTRWIIPDPNSVLRIVHPGCDFTVILCSTHEIQNIKNRFYALSQYTPETFFTQLRTAFPELMPWSQTSFRSNEMSVRGICSGPQPSAIATVLMIEGR